MRRICTVLLLSVLWPCMAMADEFDQGLATLWEVLWHQSGTPTRIVRWEGDIRVRIFGLNAAAHREHTLEALRAVTGESGVKLTDVSDQPDAARTANLSVEITSDNALEDNQPCVTYLDFSAETKINSASVQMRSKDAWRCAYHEAMHVMGVRGHPAGQTVLSYFPWKIDGLLFGRLVRDELTDSRSFITDAGGAPVYDANVGFDGAAWNAAGLTFSIDRHSEFLVGIKASGAMAGWQTRLNLSHYWIDTQDTRTANFFFTFAQDGGGSQRLQGDTGWWTFDAGIERDFARSHLAFGVDANQYSSRRDDYLTSNWRTAATPGSIARSSSMLLPRPRNHAVGGCSRSTMRRGLCRRGLNFSVFEVPARPSEERRRALAG